MKAFIFYLLLLGLLPALHAQSYRPSAEREFKSLTGTVYIIPFFIDTQVDSWTTCLAPGIYITRMVDYPKTWPLRPLNFIPYP